MRTASVRTATTRLALLVGLITLATAALAREPRPPSAVQPPEPPSPPEVSVKGFTIRAGETHTGNIVRFAPSISIEGTLDGDLYVTAPTVRISGIVTGDVFAAGSQVDVTGEIKKSFRAAAASVFVDGIVHDNLLVTGGALNLGGKSHVNGSASAYTGEFKHHGVIDGSLTFTGGTAILGGKVLGDATITADALEIEPGARVEGDIDYSTRKAMDDELRGIAGGAVTFSESPVEAKEREERDVDVNYDLAPSKFGIGKWIAFFTASSLFGCAMLALFGDHESEITRTIGADALRCTGIGFVSVLVTIAVTLSAILLITIPFVFIYLVAYVVAFYLAKIPVAIWVGRFILAKANRPSGPYLALFVGLVVLYVIFMLPVLGWIAWIVASFLGLGAMTMTYLARRQARQAPVVGAQAV